MSDQKVKQIQCQRHELPVLYREVVTQNPLLARIEGQCRSLGWTDEEIRSIQLLAACRSNASLMQRLQELEQDLSRTGVKG